MRESNAHQVSENGKRTIIDALVSESTVPAYYLTDEIFNDYDAER